MSEHYIPSAMIADLLNDPGSIPPALLTKIQRFLMGQGNLCGAGEKDCFDAVMPAGSM